MNSLVAETSRATPRRPGLRILAPRRLVHRRLEQIDSGSLTLFEGDQEHRFGTTGQEPSATLRVADSRFYGSLLLGGSLGAAESYLAGEWTSDDLTQLIRLMARNRGALSALDGGTARIGAILARLYHWTRPNTVRGSQRNILAHYDLGNELFERFLDPSLTYSCAYFETATVTLEEAQTAKIDRLCQKLRLQPSDHLLEIGTGWGSCALHAARHYGCRVTTTTISPSQYRAASQRIAQAGLADRVRLLQSDYRDLTGRYDKLVSIEMIEAVGLDYLPLYFSTCADLLKPDGLMALQAITIADRNYASARQSVDFIQRYIFPGGALPSVSAMTTAVASSTDLTPLHLEEMGLHYAETLRRWRTRFDAQWSQIEAVGFDERFRRLWHYYFAYCEGAFEERVIGLVQLVLAKPEFRADSVRGKL